MTKFELLKENINKLSEFFKEHENKISAINNDIASQLKTLIEAISKNCNEVKNNEEHTQIHDNTIKGINQNKVNNNEKENNKKRSDKEKKTEEEKEHKNLPDKEQNPQSLSVTNNNTIRKASYNDKLFFSAPDSMGRFENTNKYYTHSKDKKSIYEFNLIASGKANVNILEDDNVQLKVINGYETYLEGIIEDEHGSFSTNARKIITIESGIFELKNNYWIKQKPIKVRFE